MSSATMDDDGDSPNEYSVELPLDLCEQCQNLGLSKVVQGPLPEFYHVLSETSVPMARIISELPNTRSACRFCLELQLAAASSPAEENEDLYLLALPAPTAYSFRSAEMASFASPEHTTWLQPMPYKALEYISEDFRMLSEIAQMTGWAACYPRHQPKDIFQLQPITVDFNSELASKWLSSCRRFHGDLCNQAQHIPGLVLIDCEDLSLTSIPHQVPYVALSYVWGKASSADATVPQQIPPQGTSCSLDQESLSQVVKDSITVSKQLGFRYLWIDKYCIDQSDPVAKRHQIENMDLIYMGAELTIIAAAGDDETHGLPGVGIARDEPFIVTSGDFTIMHVPTEIWCISRQSTWASRAWTFQEELLSRRRLYFSDEQVSFVCHEMTCSDFRGGSEYVKDAESMRAYSTASLGMQRLSRLERITQTLSHIIASSKNPEIDMQSVETVRTRLKDIRKLISDYSSRDLSFDCDALRALAGVYRVFEEGAVPIYNVQGLPVVLFNDLGTPGLGINLVSALCWEHHQPETSRRRIEFPSWSWAAWTGRIHFNEDLMHAPLFEVGSQETHPIIVQYPGRRRMMLQELGEALVAQRSTTAKQRHIFHATHANRDETRTTLARDITTPLVIEFDAPFVSAEHFRFSKRTDWATGRLWGMRFVSNRTSVGNDDMPFSPLYFLNGVRTGALACIVLRIDRSVVGCLGFEPLLGVHMLIVQWIEGYAQRIGKLRAGAGEDASEMEAMFRTLKWKKVRLV